MTAFGGDLNRSPQHFTGASAAPDRVFPSMSVAISAKERHSTERRVHALQSVRSAAGAGMTVRASLSLPRSTIFGAKGRSRFRGLRTRVLGLSPGALANSEMYVVRPPVSIFQSSLLRVGSVLRSS